MDSHTAGQSIDYTIAITGGDDVVEIWLGDTAYSGRSCTYHDLAQAWSQSNRQVAKDLVKGSYTACAWCMAREMGI
jgi:type 1 glutamine amidotransferase